MAVLKFDNVTEYRDRHGRARYRFRRKGSPQVALPGPVGSEAFMEAYQRALAASPERLGANRTKAGSVSAALVAYYASAEWKLLALSTQQMRRNILEAFRARTGEKDKRPFGDRQIASFTREALLKIRDRKGETPHAANNLLKTLRQFLDFAVARKLIRANPAIGIKPLKVKGDGFTPWTEAHVEQYRQRWPSGTKQRLALELFNNTSQRRGDVTGLGRQHDRGDALVLRQGKTKTDLTIPITPALRRELDQVPKTQMTFLETEVGRPYSPAYLGNKFAEWCKAAGLPDHCRAHGIRKTVATRLADAGHSVHEIAAITGHKSLSEVARYTKAADQKRNAARTVAALSGAKTERHDGEPESPVGEPSPNQLISKGKNAVR